MEKLKVFISQPMRDRTDEEILAERNRIINVVKEKYPDKEIEVLDTFFQGAPHEARPLWYLGESLKYLSTADLAVFGIGWRAYRGCVIEHECCEQYGIEYINA